jgi:hypothetical protein
MADRAPQLSWPRGGRGGHQRRRLLEPARAASPLRDLPRETLANLSITGHLRCFSDQPVAEIVQCGAPITSTTYSGAIQIARATVPKTVPTPFARGTRYPASNARVFPAPRRQTRAAWRRRRHVSGYRRKASMRPWNRRWCLTAASARPARQPTCCSKQSYLHGHSEISRASSRHSRATRAVIRKKLTPPSFQARTHGGDRPEWTGPSRDALAAGGAPRLAQRRPQWRQADRDRAPHAVARDCNDAPIRSTRRRCRSPSGMTQSRHSRRAVPITRSQ